LRNWRKIKVITDDILTVGNGIAFMNIQCLENLKKVLLQNHADSAFPQDAPIPWEACPSGMDGDITVNCFRIAKNFKCAP